MARAAPAGWHAELDLRFAVQAGRTVLAGRRHEGPLRVQKALYPEGGQPCHVVVLHPPAGIVGGDTLDIRLALEAGAQACLTTPGATKWYRSAGAPARQALDFRIAADAVLEWLPQENIVFDGARAQMRTAVTLAANGRYLGWEVLCLGRRASGESFVRGQLDMTATIADADGPLWLEQGLLAGSDPLLAAPAGLAGRPVCATLLMAGLAPQAAVLDACRALATPEGDALAGLSWLPRVLVGRYLGYSAEAARAWLLALWEQLRPVLAGRAAVAPRIWKT